MMNDKKVNLFVVGAAKAGTTTIAEMLAQHASVYAPSIKEPNHFNTEVNLDELREDHKDVLIDLKQYFNAPTLEKKHLAFVQDSHYYDLLYKNGMNHKFRLDASTSYLFSVNAAKNIKNYNPESKIIIVLRNPVERTISHYLMDAAKNNYNLDNALEDIRRDYNSRSKGYFKTNLYIDLSLYFNQVKRYIDVFSHKNILFLSFDDLKRSQNQVAQKLFNFLELNFPENFEVLHSNQTRKLNSVGRLLKKIAKGIPENLRVFFQPLRKLFSKPLDKSEVSSETIEYIDHETKSDWEKTQQLLNELGVRYK